MANKGTSIDLAPAKSADDEAIRDFNLDANVLDLLFKEPFYGAVMRSVDRVRTESLPTAGVAPKGKDKAGVHFYWNPRFLAGLSPAQVRGLIKHECWHIILGHIFERRMEPHLMHNYATDWAINCHIPDDELPEGGLYPSRPFTPLTDEQREKMSGQQIQDFDTMSAFQEGLPKFKSSEWYFAELMKNKDAKDALDRSQKGDTDGDNKGTGKGEGDGNPMPGTDDHGGWGELTDEEREVMRGKIKKALGDAAKEADSKANWGSIPQEGRETIRKMLNTEIPWQSVLKRFCGTSRRANRTTTWTRVNTTHLHPKWGPLCTGAKRSYTSSIAVYIDQSGSVDSESLALLFGELGSLAKHTEFVCYHFDTEVDEDSETVWKKGRIPDVHRTRFGGTDFRAPTKHANKNRKRFDGYLILTDGECGDPGPSKLKRGWVIIPGRKMMFDPSKRDFVISMKGREE